jgi:hypothetical protein
MSDSMTTEDPDLLAAEYVLGTLDPDQRAQAHVLLGVDLGFVAMVRLWERRLGELHQMVEPVEPDKALWERISKRVNAIQQNPIENHNLIEAPPTAPVAAPAAEPPVVADVALRAPVEDRKAVQALVAVSKAEQVAPLPAGRPPRVGAWRALALIMTLAVLLLGSLNVAWFYFPEQLPELLRPPFDLTTTEDEPDADSDTPAPDGGGPPFEE